MQSPDLILASSRVLTDDGLTAAEIHIHAGKVRAIGPRGSFSSGGARVIDFGDLVLMPGVVDTHVHVNEPGRTEWEGFHSASRAAAAGGVTTMVVMPLNCSPVATNVAALLGEVHAASASSIIDFGLWGGVVPGNTADLEPLRAAGALGFKAFMVHSGIDEFPGVDRPHLLEAMQQLRTNARMRATGLTVNHSPVLLAHAEDAEIIDDARVRSGLDASPRSYAAYLASRPDASEVAAVQMLIELCRLTECPVHVVHVSSAAVLPLLRRAIAEGLPITAETCPHYLALTSEHIGDGQTHFKCAPPIRSNANRELLWAGLADGTLCMVASDHSPCPPSLKCMETGDFARAWGGISSLQLTLPILWTHARERGFSLGDVSRWLSAAPARLAGLHDSKGRIAPGMDADIIVFDPDAACAVRAQRLHHRHTLTPYDGLTLRGVVNTTFVRGHVVYQSPAAALPHSLAPALTDSLGFANKAPGQWLKPSQV